MSGTANQEELIGQFADVAGIDNERARFYLEAAGWELDLALASFYEADHDAEAEMPDANPQSVESASAPLATGMETLQGLIAQAAAQAGRGENAPKQPKSESSGKPPGRTGLATLSSIRNQEAEDDSSDEEQKRQSFYTGGSTTSGQQVLGPVKNEEFIKDLFQKAKEHGATADEPSSSSSAKKRAGAGGAFGGTGFKLGDSTTPASVQTVPATPASPAQSEPQEVVLRLWKTGFTVNDGELRDYKEPANQEFINTIKRGEIPRELIRNSGGREVELAMEDRRREEYEPPKVAAKPFSGKGQMLGSPAPTVVGSTANVSESDKAANETNAREQIRLIESEPSTNIQIRLADGSRLVARFNHTHTVNDLHAFINTARPQYSASNYILSIFPNTELTQRETTVKDANLLNAAVIQKIK